jgi:hypothetical protein
VRYSVRGKTAGAFKGAGSFQWTNAVRALSIFFLSAIEGVDALGNCIARRFIHRTNSERKRPGPVSLSLNQKYLESRMIEVVVDGRLVLDVHEIAAVRRAITKKDEEATVDVPLAAQIYAKFRSFI